MQIRNKKGMLYFVVAVQSFVIDSLSIDVCNCDDDSNTFQIFLQSNHQPHFK